MKKILFIIPTLIQTSGVAAFMMNYLSRLQLDNFKVEVIYNDFNVSSKYLEILEQKNIKSYKLPYVRNVGFSVYYKEVKKFFKAHNDYEVIYSNASYQSYLFFKEAKKYGIKKFAMHSHATQASDKKFKNFVGNIIQHFTNKIVKYRIACSNAAGMSMFKGKDFTIINNAIDYDKFKFNLDYRKKIRDHYNIADGEKIIGFVGRFSIQKNIFFFIKLVEKLNDNFKIMMIGKGSLKEQFENEVKEKHLEDRFIFVEETSNVNEYYSAFDYFALPSLYEGLPVVGVEAQANGLPCLFSNTISDECKISDNTRYLNKDNLNEWLANIATMSRNDDLKLNDDFNINIQARKFEILLTKIIND